MRIDGLDKPDMLKTKGTEAARGAETDKSSRSGGTEKGSDSLHLSRFASTVRSLTVRIAEDDAAIRGIRLQELKQAVRDGNYSPDPHDTAESMLEHRIDE